MKLIVRSSKIDDIDSILRIKSDPKVACHQYPVDQTSYSEMLRRVLEGDDKTGIVTSKFSTIDEDSKTIGYVRHDHYEIEGVRMVSCAWNLISSHWGQGIMKQSLTQLLNEWIFDLEVQHVLADHFRSNERCKRLLDRLVFVSQVIPLLERLTTAYQQRSLQWVVRRRLDASTWKSVSSEIPQQVES